MITIIPYLLSVLKTLSHFNGVGLSLGACGSLGLRLVKLSRLHEGLAHLIFETPNGDPEPPPGPLPKRNSNRIEIGFWTFNVLRHVAHSVFGTFSVCQRSKVKLRQHMFSMLSGVQFLLDSEYSEQTSAESARLAIRGRWTGSAIQLTL